MRRYLTGIDWVVNTLDYICKKKTGVGNISQIVLELDGKLNEAIFKERLVKCISQLPILCGYPARALNLCPYWKIDAKTLPLVLDTHYLDKSSSTREIISYFEDSLNKPFQNKREHLIFNLAFVGEKSYLGMVFDHRLMEARGAEAFLNLLGAEEVSLAALSHPEESSHLDKWLDKFRAGRKINRIFLRLAKAQARVLPQPKDNAKSNVRLVSFDAQSSARITDSSFKEAGYLMLTPFLLAKSVFILHRIFEQKKILRNEYFIPVSIDNRAQSLVKQDPFFNHLSFFLFRITPLEAENFQLTLAAIKRQMYEQVSMGLPEAIKEASYLMRIAPVSLVKLLLDLLARGENASFSFSFVGESAYTADYFMQKKVNNIFHLPRVPYPPGIGIFFNQFKGKLNTTLSCFQGILSDPEIEEVVEALKNLP